MGLFSLASKLGSESFSRFQIHKPTGCSKLQNSVVQSNVLLENRRIQGDEVVVMLQFAAWSKIPASPNALGRRRRVHAREQTNTLGNARMEEVVRNSITKRRQPLGLPGYANTRWRKLA